MHVLELGGCGWFNLKNCCHEAHSLFSLCPSAVHNNTTRQDVRQYLQEHRKHYKNSFENYVGSWEYVAIL